MHEGGGVLQLDKYRLPQDSYVYPTLTLYLDVIGPCLDLGPYK